MRPNPRTALACVAMIERHVARVALVLSALGATALYADTETTPHATSSVARALQERSALAASDRTQAQRWGLSVSEWQRYRELMTGIRGSVSPATISPIEVLGIHARDEAERARYASLWAEAMRGDAGRILAFQRAYDHAVRELLASEPLIDRTRLPRKSLATDPALARSDRVLFFTAPECAPCDALLERLLARRDQVAGIDIYVGGPVSATDDAVRAWAKAHRIEPAWVQNRSVTLNRDDGVLERLAPGARARPTVLRRRGQDVRVLSGIAL